MTNTSIRNYRDLHVWQRSMDLVLEADQTIEIVPVDRAGGSLSAAQAQFREAWLESKALVRR